MSTMGTRRQYGKPPKVVGIKLPFGLRGERLLHISEAEQGLACGCVCSSCTHRLVARKGPKVVHHFAHLGASECAHGLETGLHLAAKQLLEAHKRMRIPSVEVPFSSYKKPWTVREEHDITFDDVRVETKLGGIVPDLLVHVSGRPLLIEVTVTHGVDGRKLRKIRELGLSALEIVLADFPRTPTLEKLEQELIFSARSKKWLYNVKVEAIKRQVPYLVERKPIIERGFAWHVDDCPIKARIWRGKSYANVIDNCIYCEYCADAGPSLGPGHLMCLGRRGIATYQDFLAVGQIKPSSASHTEN